MNINLKIFLIVLIFLQFILIVSVVKRKKMTMRYASLWIFLSLIMMIVVIFPKIIFKLSDLFGFEVPSNMIFILGFFLLFYISFIITTTLSMQNRKIKLLIQELSMLKESVRKDGKKE